MTVGRLSSLLASLASFRLGSGPLALVALGLAVGCSSPGGFEGAGVQVVAGAGGLEAGAAGQAGSAGSPGSGGSAGRGGSSVAGAAGSGEAPFRPTRTKDAEMIAAGVSKRRVCSDKKETRREIPAGSLMTKQEGQK